MKKFWIVLLLVPFLFCSCLNYTRSVSSAKSPFPKEMEKLEVWNGGGLIGEYYNASINVKTIKNEAVVGTSVYWYVYEIEGEDKNGKAIKESIIDSESLSLKFTGFKD